MYSARKLKAPSLPIPEITPDIERRFWNLVDLSGGPEDCWPWIGGASEFGHGRFKIDGTLYAAHRVACIIGNGPIEPVDYLVRHGCDNPPCCNPSHLTTGTPKQNVADMHERGRSFIPRGELSGTATLTETQVLAILASPLSGRKIAKEMKVGYAAVASIRSGRSWAHLPRIAANDNTPAQERVA